MPVALFYWGAQYCPCHPSSGEWRLLMVVVVVVSPSLGFGRCKSAVSDWEVSPQCDA